jgi:hypothetical protein
VGDSILVVVEECNILEVVVGNSSKVVVDRLLCEVAGKGNEGGRV